MWGWRNQNSQSEKPGNLKFSAPFNERTGRKLTGIEKDRFKKET